MKKISFSIIILISSYTIAASILAQDETNHRWKKLDNTEVEQLWFDAASVESLTTDKFEVWVLQVHKPPLKSEGIEGEVYRSKILYAINLTTVKYGIMKLRYYDVKNNELYRFDYDTPPPPNDLLKYPYPVFEDSPVYLIIKKLFGKDKESNQ